jgi:hypothetical protein
MVTDALEQSENPSHIEVKCTAEFLIQRTAPILHTLERIKNAHNVYASDKTGEMICICIC